MGLCASSPARESETRSQALPPQPVAQLMEDDAELLVEDDVELLDAAPSDTKAAIVGEVGRLRGLPVEEQQRLGCAYTDPEALFHALHALDGSATVLLRAS